MHQYIKLDVTSFLFADTALPLGLTQISGAGIHIDLPLLGHVPYFVLQAPNNLMNSSPER